MHRQILFIGALAFIATAKAGAANGLEVDHNLLASSTFCSGHVSGHPQKQGQPGPHITWQAHISPLALEQVIAHYRQHYGVHGQPDKQGCVNWHFNALGVKRALSVCPANADGPWAECKVIPTNTKTIVMTSALSMSPH